MAHEFEQNALADNDVGAGQIDIGGFKTVAPLYLPRLIAGFRQRYSGVEICLHDGEQHEPVQGPSPNIVFSSPSIEMVRGMVGQGFGFSVLVTRPHCNTTYDGKQVVCVDITEDVTGSGLIAAWLKRAQLTKPAQLFVDYCKAELGEKRQG